MLDTRYRMSIDDTGEVENAATNVPTRRFASITGVIFEWGYYHRTFDPPSKSPNHQIP